MQRLREYLTPLRLTEIAAVGVVMFITFWELHPNLVLNGSLMTGGDVASHVAMPAYLRTQGNLFNLTPWYPGWYDGIPAYSYYFVLPDYLAVLGSYLIGFTHAFKLGDHHGFAPDAGDRLSDGQAVPGAASRARGAGPGHAPVPVRRLLHDRRREPLLDARGRVLVLALAGRGPVDHRTLRPRGAHGQGVLALPPLALSASLAAHVLPWFFAIAAVGVLVVFELLQRLGYGDPRDGAVRGGLARPVRFAVGAGVLSLGFSAWWFFSFATTQNLTNSMGYTNLDTSTFHAVFTALGWFTSTGGAAGDRWVIVGAAVSCVAAFVVRNRLGMVLATLTVLSFCAFKYDPQSVIWNERLVPFWFVSIHLVLGWFVGYLLARWAGRGARGSTRTALLRGRRPTGVREGSLRPDRGRPGSRGGRVARTSRAHRRVAPRVGLHGPGRTARPAQRSGPPSR